MNADKVEKMMRKTHIMFRRNQAATRKAQNLASFARTLDPEALALMVISLIANLAPTMTKAKLATRLMESFDEELWGEVEPLLEEFEYPKLTVRELNSNVMELTS